ncbi:leucine-rich repeat serine/threonine-protein kinase 1-like isoform X2 [Gigantopelta aegis]|uniref:leucine-rich repeat serine/threonine-protein kinase 1-like isoform X2 n=1 Tax=Gigantopelta aegis TaxID=1735272 RepID=UPI001B88A924|nr:leucine-rich repeat serine/threonine-protein kinase 1-like isoform X2 [Gigantopelta aegis]
MAVSLEDFGIALDLNDVDTLLQAINEGSDRFLEQLFDSDRKYFHELCELGHANVVEMILTRRSVDLEEEWQQKTPLQLAAANGHADLVSLLLCRGSELSDDIGADDSPFYLATQKGHVQVLRKLTDHRPLLKQSDAHSHLLLAACDSGSLETVKFWIWPHVNLNNPPEIVSSLDKCEEMVPLWVACRGNHLEVAKFLLSVGAVITKHICRSYPETTQKLVEDYFHTSRKNKYYFIMTNMQLEALLPCWFSNHLVTLTKMDLSNNELMSLPSCIPWSMPRLTSLDVSNNKLNSLLGPDSNEQKYILSILSLKSVNLSHNRLESMCVELFRLPTLKKLNVSNNNLSYLMKITTSRQDRQSSSSHNSYFDGFENDWLPSLIRLDISNNKLKMLPSEIRNCGSLQHLIVNNNELCAFPSPWPCRLQHLDISNNCLETQRFLVSAEEFWSDSLKILRIDHNELDEISESIVKLSELKELHASHNKIERLPEVESWDCRRLIILDLGDNKLGVPLSNEQVQRITRRAPKTLANMLPWKSNAQEKRKALDLPRFLGDCLQYLSLANNNLSSIPDSVNHLFNIIQLNVIGNPLIKALPEQMGLLKKCVILELDGTGIPADFIKDQKPADLIRELKLAWRQSRSCNKIKLIVLGPKEKGKTSLIRLLKGERLEINSQNNDISVHQWKYSPSKLTKKNPEVTFNIWEIPGDKTVMQSCFMTPNALYALVFDLRTGKKGVQQLSEWLGVIQNTVPGSYVLLIGTFMDKLNVDERELKLREINAEITKQYIYTQEDGECPVILCFHSLSCTSTDGISELRRLIYDKARTIRDLFYHKQFIITRKMPRSYVLVEESLERRLKELESKQLAPVLQEKDLQEIFDSIPSDDIRLLDDQDKAIQYLVEIGKMLHFNDQMEGLNSIYFLKPVYLQEMLNLVLADREDMPQNAEIAFSQIQQCFDQQNFPMQFFLQYIQILKKFEIALDMDEGKMLMVPSKLPKQRPVCHADNHARSSQICRLYRLPYIPSGLWTKLIIRVLQATTRFSHSHWFLGGQSVRDKDRKFCREKSVYGFRIKEKAVTYWREGIHLLHRMGTIMIESVKCRVAHSTELGKGILISVHSTNKNFSVMGIIVDELDDILHDYFQGFQDFIMEMPAIYAVCPDCFDHIKDDADAVVAVDHFHVWKCAAAVFSKSDIVCPRSHNVQLSRLVPEMLFGELPKKFILDPTKLEFEEQLGAGAGGLVYRGRYDGNVVALKVFHMARDMLPLLVSTDSGSGTWSSTQVTDDLVYDNCEFHGQMPNNPFHSKDAVETKERKAYRAFTEFRREISVMSKLRHPCIISFLGISIVNNLVLTMEMAMQGSLRAVLNKMAENQDFNKYRDREKVFRPVLGKEITYKIIYQIAKGLQYLHDHSVIYRDLKSDNILVCSLDVGDVVNAKLTDYGISKFSTTQGLVGFKGTMGYMAPEIMCNYTYNEKVDIFSFSMVMSEIITGHLPYEKCTNLGQLHQAIIKERQRPSVQDYNIVSHFPYLEHLMSRCWSHEASSRPSAETIANCMHEVSFLCQHEVIRPANNQKHFGEITCMASASESSSTKKNFLWFWENNREKAQRMYSIFDLETSRFHVFQNLCQGSEVTCMAKVGRDMWIGTMSSEVEILSCQNTGVPRCMERLQQESSPIAILHVEKVGHTHQDDQNLGHVFLGLNNGLVVIYEHIPESFGKTTDVWKQVQTSILGMGKPVRSMTFIDTRDEIWAVCGQQIFIFCTVALTMKMKLDVFSNSNIEKQVGRNRIIKDIVAAGTTVWCSFKNSSKILEFDAELAEVTYILHVKGDGVYCKYLGDWRDEKGQEVEEEEDEDEESEEEESSEEDEDPEGLNQTWPMIRHSSRKDSQASTRNHRAKLDSNLYLLPAAPAAAAATQNIPEYLDVLSPEDGVKS